MFKLDIKVGNLIRTLDAATRAPAQEPARNRGRWQRMMQAGTARHFSKLSSGGSDGSALGGAVNWSTARSRLTVGARVEVGAPPRFPLLEAEGDMKRAFTTGARFDAMTTSTGSRGTYRTTRAQEEAKARKHQLGGPHEADFNGLVVPNYPFPRRQFLYWDARMESEALSFLVDSIQNAVKRT